MSEWKELPDTVQFPPPDPKPPRSAWLVILIVVVVGALMAFIIWSSIHATQIYSQGGVSTSPPTCSTQTQGLPSVPLTCCAPALTGDSPQDRQYGMYLVNSAVQVPYSTVCRELCSEGATYNPATDTCSYFDTDTDRANFGTCIKELKPVNCQGQANPVAVDAQGTPYYAQRIQKSSCTSAVCPTR